MKYRIKRARGFYRVAKSGLYLSPVYTIMAQGTSIPRITSHPVADFAALYRANKVFNVWKPRHGWYVRAHAFVTDEVVTVACFNNKNTALASAEWWENERNDIFDDVRVIPGGVVK